MQDSQKIKQLVRRIDPDLLAQVREGSRLHLSKLFQKLAEEHIARQKHPPLCSEQLQHQRDPLTHLPNRELLAILVEQAIHRSQRHQIPFAFVFIDIDHFKAINDAHGHDVGDQVLIMVSQRITAVIRSMDILARLSGDEFCLVVEELENEQAIEQVLYTLQEALKQPLEIGDLTLNVTVSIGVSLYPLNGNSYKALLKSADLAMYDAKHHGRDRVHIFSADFNQKINQLKQQQKQLRQDIENNTFETTYDVEVELNSDRVCAVKLHLTTTNLPDISAEKLEKIAERGQLQAKLNQHMISTACQKIAHWQTQTTAAVPRVILPLLKPLLTSNHGVNFIRDQINLHRISGEQLEFEVAEKTLLTSPDANKAIARLHMMGCRISLINFGIGPSSLQLLCSGQIQKIKVDSALLNNLNDDQQSRTLLDAIISLAHKFSIRVVAIDVDDNQLVRLLYALKCDGVRGQYSGANLSELALLKRLNLQNEKSSEQHPADSSSLIEAFVESQQENG
ncbi:MAG: diguanylate cyclase [Gammaproteobacteria bacterium]|nr:diguanylate cyclase [Gammaproteobacteria bacterium]